MRKLEFVKYKMTGIEKKPNYMSEKQFHYVSLFFEPTDNHHLSLSIPWIVVGKKQVDIHALTTIRCNLYSIAKQKANDKFFFNDAFVTLALLDGEIIAIGNSKMTKFIPAYNLCKTRVTKTQIEKYASYFQK